MTVVSFLRFLTTDSNSYPKIIASNHTILSDKKEEVKKKLKNGSFQLKGNLMG